MKNVRILLLSILLAGIATATPITTALLGSGPWNYNTTTKTFSSLPELQVVSFPGFIFQVDEIKLSTVANGIEETTFTIIDSSDTVLATGSLLGGSYFDLGRGMLAYTFDQPAFSIAATTAGAGNEFVSELSQCSSVQIDFSLINWYGGIFDDNSPSGSFSGNIVTLPEPASILILVTGAALCLSYKK